MLPKRKVSWYCLLRIGHCRSGKICNTVKILQIYTRILITYLFEVDVLVSFSTSSIFTATLKGDNLSLLANIETEALNLNIQVILNPSI